MILLVPGRSVWIPASVLTPVQDGMETRGERVLRVVTLLFLTDGCVEHLHTVAVVKELAAGFLTSACVQKGLGACGPVWAPVHQHLSRDHHNVSDKNAPNLQRRISRNEAPSHSEESHSEKRRSKCTEVHRKKNCIPVVVM